MKTRGLRAVLGSLTSQVDRARVRWEPFVVGDREDARAEPLDRLRRRPRNRAGLRERARRDAGREAGEAAGRERRRNADRQVGGDDRRVAEEDLAGVVQPRELLLRILGGDEQMLRRVLVRERNRVLEVAYEYRAAELRDRGRRIVAPRLR